MRRHLQLGRLSGQRAFNLGIGQHANQRGIFAVFGLQRVGYLQLALGFDLELHGRRTLQVGQQLVAAIGIAQIVDLQLMPAAGVFIDAIEVQHLGFWRALPDDAINLEGQLDLDGQGQ